MNHYEKLAKETKARQKEYSKSVLLNKYALIIAKMASDNDHIRNISNYLQIPASKVIKILFDLRKKFHVTKSRDVYNKLKEITEADNEI